MLFIFTHILCKRSNEMCIVKWDHRITYFKQVKSQGNFLKFFAINAYAWYTYTLHILHLVHNMYNNKFLEFIFYSYIILQLFIVFLDLIYIRSNCHYVPQIMLYIWTRTLRSRIYCFVNSKKSSKFFCEN